MQAREAARRYFAFDTRDPMMAVTSHSARTLTGLILKRWGVKVSRSSILRNKSTTGTTAEEGLRLHRWLQVVTVGV